MVPMAPVAPMVDPVGFVCSISFKKKFAHERRERERERQRQRQRQRQTDQTTKQSKDGLIDGWTV